MYAEHSLLSARVGAIRSVGLVCRILVQIFRPMSKEQFCTIGTYGYHEHVYHEDNATRLEVGFSTRERLTHLSDARPFSCLLAVPYLLGIPPVPEIDRAAWAAPTRPKCSRQLHVRWEKEPTRSTSISL